uniref:Peptidase S54 rhomboid domain-containing protein n=1 Tax=Pseudo-nitzschia australis TaxID=44445 RepID=A0A7S4AWQ4_9STRA|mmetsp:Transcript_19961/g.43403  ORF Transcript_19961/g.43403 Transcript_19961/m.43403 type:complete len:368 (-) Transcript_19961:47-1150(-)
MPSFNNNNGGDGPPNDNPILNAFENFQRETPMITRTVMSIQVLAYVINIFFDLNLGLGNIPFFTVYKFEIYRIFTSFFVCSGFFSLIFSYISFVPTGKRLEYSMGSAEFACLFLTIGVITNVAYIGLAFLLDTLLGGQHWLVVPSSGLWNVLFGVISMECTKAPRGSERKVFLFTVPALYYPLALWGLFSFLGGFSITHLISIGIGYGFGYGYLECFRISTSRCQSWEETYLQRFISQDRTWIVSSTAIGSGAWSEEMMPQHARGQNGVDGFFSRWASQMQQQQQPLSATPDVTMGSDDATTPGAPRPGRVIKQSPTTNYKSTSNASTSHLPISGGQQLGGSTRIQNIDPRQARLQALERRIGNSSG